VVTESTAHKKSLWKNLSHILFLYLFTHNFCFANFFFQATKKVLQGSKNPENSLFEKVTLSKSAKSFFFSLSFC